jgi:uncharacterized protein (TIGR02246 family)
MSPTRDRNQAQSIAAAYTAAWNSGKPEAVAAFFAADGSIAINGGNLWLGREAVAEMAAGFFADIPDLFLTCDDVRISGSHVAYLWTFTGTHAGSGRPVRVSGWEEWDLDAASAIATSRGWFDADDYARQIAADE